MTVQLHLFATHRWIFSQHFKILPTPLNKLRPYWLRQSSKNSLLFQVALNLHRIFQNSFVSKLLVLKSVHYTSAINQIKYCPSATEPNVFSNVALLHLATMSVLEKLIYTSKCLCTDQDCIRNCLSWEKGEIFTPECLMLPFCAVSTDTGPAKLWIWSNTVKSAELLWIFSNSRACSFWQWVLSSS